MGDKSSLMFDAPWNMESMLSSLLNLFRYLKIKPYHKADFTSEELNSGKRDLHIQEDGYSEVTAALPAAKRRRGCQEQNKDEQDISEASLNKIVGAADTYDLEEMEPPHTLMCKLRPYQKQALYWMSGWEKGIDAEKAAQTLHPCWSAYHICDEYVDVFSFGIALWETLTGEEPYASGIVNNTLRPRILKRCDPEWRKLMEECWLFEPASRPSFTEITNRLRQMSAALQPKQRTPIR